MKASDIPDDVCLQAVRETQGLLNGVPHWSSLWHVQAALPQYPPKVVRAKLASLIKRGKLRGTAADRDRGDFEIV